MFRKFCVVFHKYCVVFRENCVVFRELFVVFQEYVVVFADMGHCSLRQCDLNIYNFHLSVIFSSARFASRS